MLRFGSRGDFNNRIGTLRLLHDGSPQSICFPDASPEEIRRAATQAGDPDRDAVQRSLKRGRQLVAGKTKAAHDLALIRQEQKMSAKLSLAARVIGMLTPQYKGTVYENSSASRKDHEQPNSGLMTLLP
jgi:hypothetical protein